MKSINFTLAILAIAAVMAFVTGCANDPCRNENWQDYRVQIGHYQKTGKVMCK